MGMGVAVLMEPVHQDRVDEYWVNLIGITGSITIAFYADSMDGAIAHCANDPGIQELAESGWMIGCPVKRF